MNTTYTLTDGRTLELTNLNKFQVGMTTRNGEYLESYAIISMDDTKKLAKGLK